MFNGYLLLSRIALERLRSSSERLADHTSQPRLLLPTPSTQPPLHFSSALYPLYDHPLPVLYPPTTINPRPSTPDHQPPTIPMALTRATTGRSRPRKDTVTTTTTTTKKTTTRKPRAGGVKKTTTTKKGPAKRKGKPGVMTKMAGALEKVKGEVEGRPGKKVRSLPCVRVGGV
ncbi:hypothetical protein MMC34_006159 [Xylographa carneopallida]|nr:hypothetical protein [Xylographa carneopallida]